MPIITISRGTFSGGKVLAECVGSKLGYRLLSREVLVDVAQDYGIPLDKLEHALSDRLGILERMGLERVHYLAYIQEALCKEVQNDGVVYHGHAGHILLRGVPHVLRVRVVAGIEFRIKAAMERKQLTRQQAIDFIHKRDEDRAKWTRFLYHVDWLDPALYDLVINLDHTSLDTACEVVCMAAKQPTFQVTPESQRIMNDLFLTSTARARIAAEAKGRDKNIEVDAENGVVTISGVVPSIEDADIMKSIVNAIPGVTELVSHIKVRTHW